MNKSIINFTKKLLAIFALFIVLASPAGTFAIENGYSQSYGSLSSSFSGWDSEKQAPTSGGVYQRLKEAGKSDADAARIAANAHLRYYSGLVKADQALSKLKNNADVEISSNVYGEAEFAMPNSVSPKNQEGINAYRDFLSATNELAALKLELMDEHKLSYVGGVIVGKSNDTSDQPENLREGISVRNSTIAGLNDGSIGITSTVESGASFFNPNGAKVTNEQTGETKTIGSGKISCGITSTEEFTSCIAIGAYYIFLKGGALLLGLVGTLFNMTLELTLNFGAFASGSQYGLGGNTGAIYIGWSTIRNFVNVAFIFVLLYVSIATILQIDKYGAKKMVTKIVIAALMLNFSLFFTKAIIDLSNVLALQFYSRILEGAKAALANEEVAKAKDGGISAGIQGALGLTSIWGTGGAANAGGSQSPSEFAGTDLDSYKLLIVSVMGGLFMVVFAFTLFMATLQFFFRTVVLIFVMVTSAIGFLSGAIPGLEKVSSQWWSRLTSNAIFAPAYMAVLYVVTQIIFGPANATLKGSSGFRELIIGSAADRINNMGILLWFIFVTALLIGTQIVAKMFADNFGGGITSAAGGYFKKGVKAPFKFTGKYLGKTGMGGLKATGTGIAIASRKAATSGIGRAVLTKTSAGQKLYDNAAAAEVKRMKEKAKVLRRGLGESDDNYNSRKNALVNRAVIKQAKGFGLNPETDFTPQTDKNTGLHLEMKLNDTGRDKIKKQKVEAQKTFMKYRRKRAISRIDSMESAYAKAKAGSSSDLETKLKKLEADLDKTKESSDPQIQDKVYIGLLKQYKKEQDDATADIAATLGNNGTVTEAQRKRLKEAKKELTEHTAETRALEKEIASTKIAIEKAKRGEKDAEEKKKDKDAAKKKK